MIRVNRPLLVISLVTVAVFGVGGFLLNRFQVSRHRSFYFTQAQKSRDAGDLPLAISQFTQAIRLGKRDYESHAQLAQTLLKIPSPQAAYLEGLRAEQLEAGRFENHKLLAESAMMVGQFNDVQTWATKLLDARPNDPEFLLMRARARFGSTDYPQAAEDYEQLVKDPEAPVAAWVELATLYADPMNDLDKGRGAIDRLLENENGRAAYRVAHGNWYLAQHTKRSISATMAELQAVDQLLAIAKQDALLAMDRYSEEPSASILAVRAAISSRQPQQAVDLGEKALEKFPDERDLYPLVAAAAQELGDKTKASQILAQGLRRFPEERDLLWQYANLQLELKDFDQTASTILRLEKTRTPKPQIRYLQARLLAAQKKYLDAIKAFETTRTELVGFPEFQRIIDLELATCFEGIGDRAGQIQALRRATAQSSGFLAGREQLAIALLGAGRIDEATAEYKEIATGDRAPIGAALNLARLLVLQNLALESSKRSWGPVESILNNVESVLGPQQEVAVIRAEMLMAREQVDEARQLLAAQPASETSFGARILLEVNQRQWENADALIDQAQKSGLDSVELRRSRAIRAVYGNDPDQQGTLNALLQTPESWTPEQVLELEKDLLPIALSGEMGELTKSIASKILAKDPSHVASRFAILTTQLRAKDGAGMRESLGELERISGRNAMWNYGQALAIIVDENAGAEALDRAQQYLNNASALRPDWAEALALSAIIYDRQRNIDAAIAAYEQAIKLGWRRSEDARRLIDLLVEKGRFSEADSVIRRLSQSSPALSSSMSRKASEISWRLDDLQRAAEKAEEAARVSQDANDYLWLSQVRTLVKDNAGAEQALQRAMQLNSNDTNVQFAWVVFLRRSARMDEAQQAALELDTRIDRSDPLQVLKMANLFQALGMPQDQQRAIAGIDRSTLKSREEFQRYFELASQRSPTQRSEFLQELIDRDSSLPDPEIAPWARRQLALEVVNLPQGPQFQQARALVQKNLESQPKSIEDRKILGMIAAVQNGNSNPAESLAIFQQLLREGWTPNPDEQFILGQLLIASGDWSEGSRYFTQLLSRAEGRNPQHLKRYIQILLARKDATEAELWLDALRRDGVQDTETAEMLTEIRYQRGQFNQLLRGLLGADTSYPETAWFQATLSTRQRFELLTSCATRLKRDGHDALYEQFTTATDAMKTELESAADFPGAFYAYQLLARKEYDKSLSALERVIQSASQDQLIAFTDAMLASDGVTTDQIERLEKMLESANRPEDALAFKVLLARLQELRGNFSGAERNYRDLIAADPKHAVSLNNLANLLALRGEKLDEALDLANRAIAVMGETPMLLDTRGVCYMAKGNLSEARKDLSLAVQQYPHPLIRFHLAQAIHQAREFAAAKQELDRAVQSGLRSSMLPILERPLLDKLAQDLQVEIRSGS